MLKKIFNEEAEISIEINAETVINFKEKVNLTKKLTRAAITWVFSDNAVLIV